MGIRQMSWLSRLDDLAVLADTEPAFSGGYDKFYEKGFYACRLCGAQLFKSDAKFNSGCGWPAFSKSIDNDLNIVRIPDNSYGMQRTEVRCKQVKTIEWGEEKEETSYSAMRISATCSMMDQRRQASATASTAGPWLSSKVISELFSRADSDNQTENIRSKEWRQIT